MAVDLPAPPENPRRIAYFGTPDAAVPPLRALVAAGYEVPLVISQPDRRRGRGSQMMPSPVKAAAVELGLPVTDRVDDVLDVDADLGVVVAFGRLIKPHVLEALPLVNLHFSLLPRWRGAAPVERALLAGDERTGVCVMQLEETLDTGGVYARTVVDIGDRQTAAELRAALVEAGTALLIDTLAAGSWQLEPQVGEETYAAKIEADDLHLDWSRPAAELDRVVRVGGAWTTFRGERFRVHAAEPVSVDEAFDGPAGEAPGAPGTIDGDVVACGTGALRLREVQPANKGRQRVADWRNGARLEPGERLGA